MFLVVAVTPEDNFYQQSIGLPQFRNVLENLEAFHKCLEDDWLELKKYLKTFTPQNKFSLKKINLASVSPYDIAVLESVTCKETLTTVSFIDTRRETYHKESLIVRLER